jgi:hypothetical protein
VPAGSHCTWQQLRGRLLAPLLQAAPTGEVQLSDAFIELPAGACGSCVEEQGSRHCSTVGSRSDGAVVSHIGAECSGALEQQWRSATGQVQACTIVARNVGSGCL